MAYTREQLEKRIDEAGSGRYEFVRWAVEGEFGSRKKCVVKCAIDCFEWAAAFHSLVNGGYGCPQCSGNRRWTANERVEQINSLENIEFICWVDSYGGAHSKAKVKCKVDGFEWIAKVNDIVNLMHGCPHCAGNRRWTAEERIEQINSLDDIEFISLVGEYKNCYSRVSVKCKIHGFVWNPSVNDLVNGGKGCPRCAKYGYQLGRNGYLYALRSECGRYVKVGITGNIQRRLYELSIRTPFRFSIIEKVYGDGGKVYDLEKHFHDKYERAGLSGFDGCTEWLVCSDELLSELRGLSIEHE